MIPIVNMTTNNNKWDYVQATCRSRT